MWPLATTWLSLFSLPAATAFRLPAFQALGSVPHYHHRAPQPVAATKVKSKSKGGKKPSTAKKSSGGFGASKQPAFPEEWKTFGTWLKKEGATTDAVELHTFDDGLRGLRTTRSLAMGKEALRIPRTVILDEVTVDERPVAALWSHLPRDEELASYAKLALALIYEQRLGASSKLQPYMSMLPTTEEMNRCGPALGWTDEELAVAESAKLMADVPYLRKERDDCLELLGESRKLWGELGMPGEPPSDDEVVNAIMLVNSRAISDKDASLIVPMVDMANHRNEPRTEWSLADDGKYFVVYTTERINKGEQLFLSYGKKSNLRFLTHYGFVDPTQDTDFALLDISKIIEQCSDSTVVKEALNDRMLARDVRGKSGNAIATWQPAGPHIRDIILRRLRDSDELPSEMYAKMDLGTMSPQDWVQRQFDVEDDMEDISSQLDSAKAYDALLQGTMDTFSTSYKEDEKILKEGNLLPRAELAIKFRLSQKRLLLREIVENLEYMQSHLEKIEKQRAHQRGELDEEQGEVTVRGYKMPDIDAVEGTRL